MLTIDESFDGKTIPLAVGDQLEVRLKENPTTGSRWRIAADGAPACEREGDSFVAAGTRPGQEGVHVWRLRAARPGRARIELAYGRSWESGGAPARSFAVTVEVSNAK
jgi:inhibitor of cysteine peptidase